MGTTRNTGNHDDRDREARARETTDHSLREARELAAQLKNLADVEAPATLLGDVLAGVGLADVYFRLPTALGPVYVAYNARGVSAVSRAEDGAAFEADLLARLGRNAAPAREPDAKLVHALEATLRGERRADLRFDLRGLSEFERAVLLKALEIPRGEV